MIPPKLPPRPNQRRDDRTPPEGLTGRKSLQDHDRQLGAVARELGWFAEWRQQLENWCRNHTETHTKSDLLLEGFKTEVRSQLSQFKPRQWPPWWQLVGLCIAILGAFVGAVRWAVATHDSFLISEAKAACSALDTQVLVANQPVMERVAQQAADRAAQAAADDTRRQLKADQVARERAENMRVAHGGRKK